MYAREILRDWLDVGADLCNFNFLAGSGGRGNESCVGSGSARPSMDADEASEGNDPARTAARGNAAKRQRSMLGQPALKVPSPILLIFLSNHMQR